MADQRRSRTWRSESRDARLIALVVTPVVALLVMVPGCSHQVHSSIFDAARCDDANSVGRFLADGESPNAVDSDGRTVMHVAAEYGSVQVARVLAARGAHINALGMGRVATPLHAAAAEGHVGMMAFLISKGADVNARGHGGETPLHYAAANGQFHAVRFLVAHRARVNVSTRAGWTPLWSAAGLETEDVAHALMDSGASAVGANFEGYSALHQAVRAGNEHLARLMISRGAQPDIFVAAGLGDTKWIRRAIRHGADVNTRDGRTYTPLHWAAEGGKADAVSLLMTSGARVSDANCYGYTPLHLALRGHVYTPTGHPFSTPWRRSEGNRKVAKMLIAYGASTSAKTDNGYTPLDYASSAGYRDVVELLRRKPESRARAGRP